MKLRAWSLNQIKSSIIHGTCSVAANTYGKGTPALVLDGLEYKYCTIFLQIHEICELLLA